MELVKEEKKEFISELKQEWKLMWASRFDDKVLAESIADKTYDRLFVERGTVLFATRNYRPLEFRSVLEKYISSYDIDLLSPSPAKGGIRKFIREYITPNKPGRKSEEESYARKERAKRHQSEQCRRGWLHMSMP